MGISLSVSVCLAPYHPPGAPTYCAARRVFSMAMTVGSSCSSGRWMSHVALWFTGGVAVFATTRKQSN